MEKINHIMQSMLLPNSSQITIIYESSVNHIKCIRQGDEIKIEQPDRTKHIMIPMDDIKDFALLLLESYHKFNSEFAEKTIEITVSIKEK